MRKGLLLSFGGLGVVLGAAGVILPLVPTTPFLLFSAACFARSSDRHYRWLMNHRWFGPHLRNYRERRVIPLRVKVVTLGMLWSSLGVSAFVFVSHPALRALLLAIGAGVSAYILRFRNLSPTMAAEKRTTEAARGE